MTKKQINLAVRVVHAGHWTRWTNFERQLFNAVFVPNIEFSTTTLCLQLSYAGNNAILGRRGKSNGTSLCFHHNLPFIWHTTVLFPYRVTTQFNFTSTYW